jgi:Domain of unknown function (DUF4112)
VHFRNGSSGASVRALETGAANPTCTFLESRYRAPCRKDFALPTIARHAHETITRIPKRAPQRDTDTRDVLVRLDALAKLMDSAITIPGTKIVMGLDAFLGLLPVVGDAISSVISGYIIWEARRLGASRWLIARMAGNAALDAVVGSVPVLGDVFDVAFKANRKNVALLQRHIEWHGVRDATTIDASYRVD